ncbi:MAG: sensor histidine kinase [Cyanobacteria bacterium J06634_6]
MSAVTSPEFISLCQTQLQLLAGQISESSAAVYIADVAGNMTDAGQSSRRRSELPRSEPDFIPVVSYPEPVGSWIENFERATAWATEEFLPVALLPGAEALAAGGSSPSAFGHSGAEEATSERRSPATPSDWPERLRSDQQMVVPLVYSEVVVGLMVAVKRDRAWKLEERHHVEGVAQSLAAGCVLEQRSQWLQHQLADKRDLQGRQSEIFHNLLHQFRNPLTAVTTFGQLLVRRLEPEDPNQKIATGIVRESKRLREMVTHFDETVAIGDADLATDTPQTTGQTTGQLPSLPPALDLLPGSGFPKKDDPSAPSAPHRFPESLHGEPAGEISAPGLGHSLDLSAQYLPDIVEPILAVTDIVAAEKGVVLQAQIATDTPSVWGEEEALGEVISNLIDNAVKYSPAGATVWVQTGVSRVERDDYYQGVVVGDTGPGIPAGDLTHLFERHYRGVQAHSEIPGTGLGLAIAQSLTLQMGGNIEVISPAAQTPWMPRQLFERDSAGAGTIFIVWLRELASTSLSHREKGRSQS